MFLSLISATTNPSWTTFEQAIEGFISSLLNPLLAIAISASAIWGIYLGIKWWRAAGDENKRKEAKNAIISFIIGILVIFLVIVVVPIVVSALVAWANGNVNEPGDLNKVFYALQSIVIRA